MHASVNDDNTEIVKIIVHKNRRVGVWEIAEDVDERPKRAESFATTLNSSNALLLVTGPGFMNMTLKMPNNLANDAPKMSRIRKKLSWITVLCFTMNSSENINGL